MPCNESDKIKRALTWIRKTLDITERTNMPEGIMRNIEPTLDALGWERRPEATSLNFVGGATDDFVITTVVPEGEMHLVIAASIESTDNANALHLWIDRRFARGSVQMAVQMPFIQPIGFAGLRVALMRPVLLAPGDRLVGRSSPAPAAATGLELRLAFIVLDPGEYVPPL